MVVLELRGILMLCVLIYITDATTCPDVVNADIYVFTIGQMCYHYVEKPDFEVTYERANTDCRSRNGELFTVQNKEMQVALAQKLNDYDVHTILMGMRKEGGTWTWDNGESVTYNNWDEESNPLSGNCAYMMLRKNGTWEVNSCGSTGWLTAYVCQHGSAVRRIVAPLTVAGTVIMGQLLLSVLRR